MEGSSHLCLEVGQPREVEGPLGGTTVEYEITCDKLQVSKTFWECEDLFRKLQKELQGFNPSNLGNDDGPDKRRLALRDAFFTLANMTGVKKSATLASFFGGKLTSPPPPVPAARFENADIFGANASSAPNLFGRVDLDDDLDIVHDNPTLNDEEESVLPATKPVPPPKPAVAPKPRVSRPNLPERTVFGPETTNDVKEKQRSPVPLPRASRPKVDTESMSSVDILKYIEQEQNSSQDDLALF